MTITVKLYGRIREKLGREEVKVEDDVKTVGELVDELDSISGHKLEELFFDPGTREIRPSFVMLVNGHSIRLLKGMDTMLFGNNDIVIDNIDIMETVGGG